MKKTMFITSVIMVVVMAIALTTSSLAWFSAAGNATVTTTALTVKAQSNSSSGLLISLDNDQFSESVTMDSSALLMPLVPIPSEDSAAAAATSAELLEALSSLSFIGNKVASGNVIDPSIEEGEEGYNERAQRTIFAKANGLSGEAVAAYTSGFYTDDLYIANMAAGSGKEVYVEPSIAFRYKADSETPYATYTSDIYRATHPIMYVAILADVTDGDYYYAAGELDSNGEPVEENGGSWVTDKASADLYDDEYNIVYTAEEGSYVTKEKEDWELVQIFSTASDDVDAVTTEQTYIAASLAVGNKAVNFTSGRVVSKATNSVATGALDKTSTKLAKAKEGANLGTAKKFRVIVWYDGATLNNNNSGWDFDFALTFTAKES